VGKAKLGLLSDSEVLSWTGAKGLVVVMVPQQIPCCWDFRFRGALSKILPGHMPGNIVAVVLGTWPGFVVRAGGFGDAKGKLSCLAVGA